MTDFGFPRHLRLLNAGDYRPVFNNAPLRAPSKPILILARPNNLGYPRLGLVVAKKHARHAVERNRIKRMIRETFRLQQHCLPAVDAVVLARPGITELDNAALQRHMNDLWHRLTRKARRAEAANT